MFPVNIMGIIRKVWIYKQTLYWEKLEGNKGNFGKDQDSFLEKKRIKKVAILLGIIS